MEARRAEAELERRRADALLTACDLGLTDDVAALIAGGATFEATDKAGVRPMTFAAARGHADVVELLCSHGVDANDDDALGRAPLHFAAMHGRARVVRALASRPGTWVDPPDHLDDTPLTLAARMADAETIAALLDAGADARARNKAGLTPLGEALLVRRRFDLADLLLEHEAGRQTDAPREKGSRDDASRTKKKKRRAWKF
jgi:ankyrin repeat protein